MDLPDGFPAQVGRQLAARRDDLDLTQDDVAERIGITTTSVSKAERGLVKINRGRRLDWERVLGLRPGTISRAYRDGSDIEANRPGDEPRAGVSEDPQQLLARARELAAEASERTAQSNDLIARAEEILRQRRA